jgi:hypothetical protein
MAMYPNNYIRSNNPYRNCGVFAYYNYAPIGGGRLGIFTAGIQKRSSVPDGYGMQSGAVQPLTAGGMSSYNRPVVSPAFTGNVLAGGPMEGSGAITFDADGRNLSLVVGMDGTSTITLTGDGNVLALTIGLNGTGTWTLTGDGNSLALIVPFEGLGHFELTGEADLRGLLSLSGEWTPYTELSPQSLAKAVWDEQMSLHTSPGTTGEKLDAAGTAGDPWTADLDGYANGTAGKKLKDSLTKSNFLALK